jgi:hypothetical protein
MIHARDLQKKLYFIQGKGQILEPVNQHKLLDIALSKDILVVSAQRHKQVVADVIPDSGHRHTKLPGKFTYTQTVTSRLIIKLLLSQCPFLTGVRQSLPIITSNPQRSPFIGLQSLQGVSPCNITTAEAKTSTNASHFTKKPLFTANS